VHRAAAHKGGVAGPAYGARRRDHKRLVGGAPGCAAFCRSAGRVQADATARKARFGAWLVAPKSPRSAPAPDPRPRKPPREPPPRLPAMRGRALREHVLKRGPAVGPVPLLPGVRQRRRHACARARAAAGASRRAVGPAASSRLPGRTWLWRGFQAAFARLSSGFGAAWQADSHGFGLA
jgi:hypothetical protein